MLLPLRDYQKSAFAQVREHIRAGKKRILLVAPTGSGKTVTSSHLLHGAHLKGNSAMFLAHRREIIYQTQEKLNDAHLEHSLIMSGHRQSMMVITHLASIQTLIRREFAGLNIKILIIDEAHHAVAGTYKRIIEAYPDAIIIGLTATPCRGDGRGLGGIFDSMVVAATVPELIELGYLVPPRIFSANIPGDVRDLHIKRGDYRMDEASDMLSTAKLVGDIVDNWCVHAPMKRTIVFATDIAHSLYIQEYFTQSGIYAEHIDGETPKNQRREILERHRAGDFPVLTNVGIATEGYDDPAIECVVLARPTRSFGLYLQMSGRGLRPNPATGKNCLILLDHAQTYREHGSPAEPVVWTLDPEGPAAKVDRKAKGSTIDTSWRCDFCHFVNDYGRYCGCCGQRRTTVAVTPEVAPGRLVEVTGKAGRRTTKSDKEKYWNECLWTCINKGWKVKRAAGMYKSRFGVWPRGFAEMPRGKAEWQLPAKNFHQKHLTRSVNG